MEASFGFGFGLHPAAVDQEPIAAQPIEFRLEPSLACPLGYGKCLGEQTKRFLRFTGPLATLSQ
jgi:hypothetical protein